MNPKTLLDEHEIHPKKKLGQNFLHDPGALEKIVASAEVTYRDTVLEVGPGTGTLTQFLARTAKKVIAVEVDERLQPILDQQLQVDRRRCRIDRPVVTYAGQDANGPRIDGRGGLP